MKKNENKIPCKDCICLSICIHKFKIENKNIKKYKSLYELWTQCNTIKKFIIKKQPNYDLIVNYLEELIK